MADTAHAAHPQPQLLLGLPSLAVQTLLSALPSNDKVTLLRTCKEARAAVLDHAPKIEFAIQDHLPGKQSVAQLVRLMATRREPLHLALQLARISDTGTTQLLTELAAQQHAGGSGHNCVRKLALQLVFWDVDGEQEGGMQAPEPAAVSWLGLVGAAFKGVKKLRLTCEYKPFQLNTAFFSGLAVCPNLVCLAVQYNWPRDREWRLGADIAAQPQILRTWLPHVTKLKCDITSYSMLPLLQGLGPQLQVLSLANETDGVLHPHAGAEIAAALANCLQLRSVLLEHSTAAMFEALLGLPDLTHVDTDELRDSEMQLQQRQQQQPLAAWQELKWGDREHDGPVELAQLVWLLKHVSVQRLVVHGDYLMIKAPPVGDTAGMARLAGDVQAVASVPELVWNQWVDIQVPPPQVEAADPEEEDGQDDPETAAAAQLQYLRATFAALAPLGECASPLNCFSIDCWWLAREMRAPLGQGVVAALGHVLGSRLEALMWDFSTNPVEPSFWAALPVHLPLLQELTIKGWDHDDEDTVEDLATFINDYHGPSLSLYTRSGGRELRSALGLPFDWAELLTLHLPLVS